MLTFQVLLATPQLCNTQITKLKKIKISEKTCSLRDVLDIIGGKWSMPIIYILSKGKLRFKEIE